MDYTGLPNRFSNRKEQELQEYLKYDKWLLRVASTKSMASGLRNSTGTEVSALSDLRQGVKSDGAGDFLSGCNKGMRRAAVWLASLTDECTDKSFFFFLSSFSYHGVKIDRRHQHY